MQIRRNFIASGDADIHYRSAGSSVQGLLPLLLLHPSPGSSKQLAHLMSALSGRRLIAPDARGNGDSTPFPMASPDIADFAVQTVAFLDALGIAQVDLYGSHTGASIAAEISIIAPGRVRRVVFDGVGLYAPADHAHMLSRYAPEIEPDHEGRHFLWAFQFCRDQFVFWPWNKRGAENIRGTGLPSAGQLHDFALEVMKSISTYHQSYRAAFRYDKRTQFPRVEQRSLALCAEDDMLFPYLDELASLLVNGTKAISGNIETREGAELTASLINRFLDAE